MWKFALVVLVVACSEPAYATDNTDSIVTLSLRDLVSMIAPVTVVVGGVGFWILRIGYDAIQRLRDLAIIVDMLQQRMEKNEAKTEKVAEDIKRVEKDGSDERNKIYRHFEGRMNATPTTGNPIVSHGGQR